MSAPPAPAAPAVRGAVLLRTIDCPRCNTRHYLASRVTECILCGHPFVRGEQSTQSTSTPAAPAPAAAAG